MTTKVYQVWSRECTVPLMIFAPRADEAAVTYREWVVIHSPNWSPEPAQVEQVGDQWLADRPQLANAMQRAASSRLHDNVILFIDHAAGWKAVPTHAAQIGAIAAPEPAVRAYEVRVEKEHLGGVEVMVFAEDPEQAIQLYREWHETFYGELNYPYEIKPFSRWTLTGDQTVLREQMDMGCVGIAAGSPVRGWSIYPPDHEMAGE